ncbi:hypothetical protein [Arthrobacter wenxiniae]|uniref:Uncharacterized protein n=1 Tax=Arthrobacter wenxiniae TaxID=2713570 RepID=A0A7Y7IEJ6_9MICC|nr:hypothetical protein [Arthrobacter wenxiniae]NVM93466.1 hypothetical protein [Arthrobacter wenxiniae]
MTTRTTPASFWRPVRPSDLALDPGVAGVLELELDRNWHSDFCAPPHVDVRW